MTKCHCLEHLTLPFCQLLVTESLILSMDYCFSFVAGNSKGTCANCEVCGKKEWNSFWHQVQFCFHCSLLLSQFSVNNLPFLIQLWYGWWAAGSRLHQGICLTGQLITPVTKAACTLFEANLWQMFNMYFVSADCFGLPQWSFPFCTAGCCEEVACFKTFMYDSESFSASKRAQRGTIEQKSVACYYFN